MATASALSACIASIARRVVALHVGGLLVDDLRRVARDAAEIEQQRRLELREDPVLDAQRIDHHPLVRVELHEVEAAERRRILVLPPAGEADVDRARSRRPSRAMSYSPSGRFSHSTKALIIDTTSVDDEPSPEPGGASVCVVMVSGKRPAAVEIANDAVVDALVQIEPAVERERRRWLRPPTTPAGPRPRTARDRRRARFDHRVRVLVDGRIEHQPAVQIAVRRDVGAAAGQAQAAAVRGL